MKLRGIWHLSVIVVLTGTIFLNNNTARAQYTVDFQTNIISGVASNWVSIPGYQVSSNTAYDVLLIQNGGVLSNGYGYIGYYTHGNSNLVVVSGSGSVWSNQLDLVIGKDGKNNSLVISNQGKVFDNSGYIGYNVSYSSNNSVLVTGSGSVWSNRSNLYVGRSGSTSSLVISNQAQVFDNSGYVGFVRRSADKVVVTGGSVWTNRLDLYIGDRGAGNSLVISGQGRVFDRTGYVGDGSGGTSSSNNSVLVTGSGSVWSNRLNLFVGEFAKNNTLVISNQAKVFDENVYVGYNYTTINNSVLVTGTGSVWSSQGGLYVGYSGVGNTLTITDGGSVIASNAFIGLNSPPAAGNLIDVSGGTLYATNRLANGVLDIGGGTFSLNSGTVTVDSLVATNGLNGQVNFSGGTLNTKATTVNNSLVFTVGNGQSAATLKLDSGGSGFHSFANGLTISSNATLIGNGTVIGAATVKGGGTLSPGLSPDSIGSITFSNNLTLAPKSVFAVDLEGNAPEQYDHITVLGTVSVSNCVLSLNLGFTPAPGYWFTIISNYGPSIVLGTFVDPQGDVLTNNATFTADSWTFQIHYDLDSTGQDVVLTGIVPEPSTLLLVALGSAGLIGLRRRFGRGRVR